MAITTKNLTYTIEDAGRKRVLLKDLNLDIPDGQITMITGASGSGKTTLLYALAGLLEPIEGEIEIGGARVDQMNEEQRNRFRLEQISFIFQESNLFPFLNVEDNILLIHHLQKKKVSSQVRKDVLNYLSMLGLEGKEKQEISALSGGEKQRVSLVRALVSSAPYIFADEPTGNLDHKNSLELMESLQHMVEKAGTSVLMVTHDLELCSYASNRIEL